MKPWRTLSVSVMCMVVSGGEPAKEPLAYSLSSCALVIAGIPPGNFGMAIRVQLRIPNEAMRRI